MINDRLIKLITTDEKVNKYDVPALYEYHKKKKKTIFKNKLIVKREFKTGSDDRKVLWNRFD